MEETEEYKISPIEFRGLHLDLCRHFLPAPIIIKIINLMGDLDLNTLHLHLSDDQSIPFESEKYPEIKENYPQSLSIQDQIDIANSCKHNNIRIIPEIDIPGHSAAFMHIFHGGDKHKMHLPVGETSESLISMDDLPIIYDLFTELVNRFGSQEIHMGGDEAYCIYMSEIIHNICNYGLEHNLRVIAWDDIYPTIHNNPPQNLIIQCWHKQMAIHPTVPVIQSHGFYLDLLPNPIIAYKHQTHVSIEDRLCGFIACTWSELVDQGNIFTTLFPTLYLLAHKFSNYPVVHPHPPILMYELCMKHGFPESPINDWRVRKWGQGKCDGITNQTPLDREIDLFPVFSQALVTTLYFIYMHLVMSSEVEAEDLDAALAFMGEATGFDLGYLRLPEEGWKGKLRALVRDKVRYYQKDHNNGIVKVIKFILLDE